MSVDLKTLPADEEVVREAINAEWDESFSKAGQNVLDALNWFRCLALHREGEITRLNAELIEVRNGAEHNRIFGRP
jgi:hypothetical protein